MAERKITIKVYSDANNMWMLVDVTKADPIFHLINQRRKRNAKKTVTATGIQKKE